MTPRRALLLLATLMLVAVFAALAGRPASQAAVAEPPQQGVGRYVLTAAGVEIASFSELGGLTSGFEPVDLTLRSGKTPTLTVPRKRTPPTITLKRGKTRDMAIWTWHEQALLRGKAAWRNAQVTAYDIEGRPVARYTLEAAWPAKVEIGALRAGASEVLMETVTIVAERLSEVAP